MPNGLAQQRLVELACRRAGVRPADIQYVEAHGTGTPVGDPIEANALASVLGTDRPANEPCGIGSVKTNIGHLEAGAGIASLTLLTMALIYRGLVIECFDPGFLGTAGRQGAILHLAFMTLVVRSHDATYRAAAMAGDEITVRTWVSDVAKFASRRKYVVCRPADQTVLARVETRWVYVDLSVRKVVAIPSHVLSQLEVCNQPPNLPWE